MENILKGLLCKNRQPLQNLTTKSLIDFEKYLIGWKCWIAPLSLIRLQFCPESNIIPLNRIKRLHLFILQS